MEKLYFDVKDVYKYGEPFNIVIAGRGTGKTYSALSLALEEYKQTGLKFIYMRRTKTEIDFIANTEYANPMKPVNENITLEKIDNRFAVFKDEESNIIGYMFALSTVASIRGIDMSDVGFWIYDEFIPEPHVKKIKNEGMAFLNAYETFNRNREFNGIKPITVFLLANSNNFNSDILVETKLQKKVEEMLRKGKSFSHIANKKCTISLPKNHIFESKKRDTVLYQFSADSDFTKMAIDNEFTQNDFANITSMSTKHMRVICCIGHIYIYRDNNRYYATRMKKTPKDVYTLNDSGEKAFLKDYGLILTKAYIYDYLLFENYEIKRILVKILTGNEI